MYTQVERDSRSRDFRTAFSWPKEAATVNLCTLSEDPSIGLAPSEDDTTVKCYLADTGLLSTMAFSSTSCMIGRSQSTGTVICCFLRMLLADATRGERYLAPAMFYPI